MMKNLLLFVGLNLKSCFLVFARRFVSYSNVCKKQLINNIKIKPKKLKNYIKKRTIYL